MVSQKDIIWSIVEDLPNIYIQMVHLPGKTTDGVTSATSDGFAVGGSLDYAMKTSLHRCCWC